MRKELTLCLVLLVFGCGRAAENTAEFAIESTAEGLFLTYNSSNAFTLLLWSEQDPRRFPHEHEPGQGRIRIFQDKGAIWLSEDGRGYGSYAPVGIASLLPPDEVVQDPVNVFRIADFLAEDGQRRFVHLAVEENTSNQRIQRVDR